MEQARHRPAPKLVAVETSPPEPAKPPAATPEQSGTMLEDIRSFEDLLNVAERKRDIRFKLMLRNNFSQIAFEPGRIEFHPVGHAPVDMAQIIDDRLRQWTGQQWAIIVGEIPGAATVKEVETETRERNIAHAESDPVVAAVLRTFPKARFWTCGFPTMHQTMVWTLPWQKVRLWKTRTRNSKMNPNPTVSTDKIPAPVDWTTISIKGNAQ